MVTQAGLPQQSLLFGLPWSVSLLSALSAGRLFPAPFWGRGHLCSQGGPGFLLAPFLALSKTHRFSNISERIEIYR
jgi:hypothetical protein